MNHKSTSSSLHTSSPVLAESSAWKEPLLASAAVSLLALLAYLLVDVAMRHGCLAPPPPSPPTAMPRPEEPVLGYVLIIAGYLLLPGVGALLVRRQRCLARNRALLQMPSDAADASFSSLCADALQHGTRGARAASRALQADVDRCSRVEQWPAHRDAQCAVCLLQLQPRCVARVLPCEHAFHRDCADLWLVRAANSSCPLCWRPVCEPRRT